MENKIKVLIVYSDRTGVGKFRSIGPGTYIQEHFADDFHIDMVFVGDLPRTNLEEYFKPYDIVHYHKQLDIEGQILGMLKFLGKITICDVDDNFMLGNDHPMSLTARKEKWHEPIVKHLQKSDYVTTTTPIYRENLLRYNKKVEVFPNAISTAETQFSTKKTPSDKLRIGIVCGSTHKKDLECLNNIASTLTQEELNKVQFVLCGFDTNGIITLINPKTGEKTQRPIQPKESIWYDYEKMITNDYKIISKEHKDFLDKFIKVDDPFVNEPYRRMWTRNINSYGTHYENVDVLLAPLVYNDFNKMKSQLKEVEAGFTNTALIAQNFGAYTIDLVPMFEKGNVINPDGTALLVDESKNKKNWSKYIKKLIANPEYVTMLKNNLHNFVLDNYTLEKVCEDRVAFYKRIMYGENQSV